MANHVVSAMRAIAMKALAAIAAGLLLVGALQLTRNMFRGEKVHFIDAYEQLQVGRTTTKRIVESKFGRRPDSVYYFKSSEIWYYRAPADVTTGTLPSTPLPNEHVSSLGLLPDTYNYVQLAFNKDGELIAYTWIGEDPQVHSLYGNRKGSFLGLLDEDQF